MNQENELTQQELIIRFVEGKLEGKDLASFKQAMQEDNSIEQEVEYFKNLKFVLSNERLFRVQNLVSGIVDKHRQGDKPSHGQSPFYKNIWKFILVSLLIFTGAIFLWWQPTQGPNPVEIDRILQSYVQPYPNVNNLNQEIENNLSKGMEAYENQDYGKAVKLLEDHRKGYPNTDYIGFYIGICYLLDNRPLLALPYFEELSEQEESIFYSSSQWYLSLTLIQLERYKRAKELLNLLKDDIEFGMKASQLLDDWEGQ